jgi:ribose/xylose/arabinose/galactoside ABC-type transport system permease subunit
LLVGVINGFVVGYLRLNPIIWTLAMMSVLSGVIRKAYAGQQVYPDETTAAGQAFLNLYHAKVLGFLPLPFAILLILAVVGELAMRKTLYGAQLKMTGSAYETARLTGVNVRGVVALAFIISAFASSIAGIMLTSFNKVGAHYIGLNYDFQSITAVVLGGMTLAGGRGNVTGVVGGAMVIVLLNRILSLVRIGDFVIGDFQKNIILGAVFILVVGINSYSRRRSGVDDE